MDWDEIPVHVLKPDFGNLLAVLRRQVPAQPTLFEFFLNDRLYHRLAGTEIPASSDALAYRQKVMAAFYAAGYDYAPVLVPGFDFPSGRVKLEQTVSINDGAVITDRATCRAYHWPDPHTADYAILEALGKDLPGGMKLIGYSPDGLLENVIKLVGYERLCYLITDDKKLVQTVFDAVGSRLVEYYDRLAGHISMGACILNDDWGFKTQTFLSPRQLREFVFPWQKEIVKVIHAHEKPVILHSCGTFSHIVDDIVDEMGIEARHSYEDIILPVEEAYERYSSRMAILGGIDVDFICRSSPEDIYQRSKAMLERSFQRGGYALGTGNSVPEYIPDAHYFAMIRAALEGR